MSEVEARIEGLTTEQESQVLEFMTEAVDVFNSRQVWRVDALHFVPWPDVSREDSTSASYHMRLCQFTHKKVMAWKAGPFSPPDTPFYKTHRFNPEPNISIAVTLNDGDRDFFADFVCSPNAHGKLQACHWVKRDVAETKPKANWTTQPRQRTSPATIPFAAEESYEARVRRYCDANQVVTPMALGRRKVARFAVVDVKAQPNQLIALTFSRASDLVTYLRRSETDWAAETTPPLRILDLQKGREMAYSGGWWLCVGSSFCHDA